MSQECHVCQAVNEDGGDFVVGPVDESKGTMCSICRADELHQRTTLSKQEAKVAAHKEISGASHAKIAERIGLEKSTVDEYSRRIKSKVEEARVTMNELDRFA